jgi:DNA-binding transcriptional MerR regulator
MTKTLTKAADGERHFTTKDVLEHTGISFRMLDYWLRTGAISLGEGSNTPGSGRSRRYTHEEMAAIRTVIDRYRRALAEVETIRSGQAWRDAVADDEGDPDGMQP